LGCGLWLDVSSERESLNEDAADPFKNFTRVQNIDSGSSGSVDLWKNNETNALVAVKTLKEPNKMEVECLRRMQHENIVKLYKHFTFGNKECLVFEYVPMTLQGLIKKGKKLELDKMVNLTKQLLSGLQHLHNNQIIHRDIKPQNLLVTDAEILKICDFGISCTATNISPWTRRKGTLRYRAPESLLEAPKYGWQIDIWALGCVVFEMLTGCPVFQGQSEMELVWKIVLELGPLTEGQEALLSRRMSVLKAREDLEEIKMGERVQELMESSKKDKWTPNLSNRMTELDINEECKNFILACLSVAPEERPTCQQLLQKIQIIECRGLDEV
jgi:cyclin-dependent kinase-like